MARLASCSLGVASLLALVRCASASVDPEPRSTSLSCANPNEQPTGLIAFVASPIDSVGRLTLHVVNADGTGLREVTNVGNPREPHSNPSFSPDGQWIAFQGIPDNGLPDIYKVRVDGSGLVNLTEPLGLGWGSPAWSPDGQTIAASAAGGFDIFLIDAETGALIRRVTEFQAPVAQTAAFTPDGEFLIVSSTPKPPIEEIQEDLWEVRLSDGGVRRITNTPEDERFLDLSPDGQLIAVFGDATEPGKLGFPPTEIHVVDRFTGRRTRVTFSPLTANPPPQPSRQSGADAPAWSPGGCYVVYNSDRDENFPGNLFIQRIDRVEPRQLTFLGAAVQADWSFK